MLAATILIMSIICPTITAFNLHEYREQMEKVAPFAKRIHIDFMDGLFTTTKSPDLEKVWWPQHITADLHIMFQRPNAHLEVLRRLKPNLVIVHAEADGDFQKLADELHAAGIKAGVALFEDTPVKVIEPALKSIDHVLIFSGDLGRHGGKANLGLLGKASELKDLKPELEISWDGGINEQNAIHLVKAGVDVLNVGGFIQNASDPAGAYAKLEQIAKGVASNEKTNT